MSTYKFKIRNNYNFTTGGTINPMIYSAYTGTQEFTKYLTIFKKDFEPPFSSLNSDNIDGKSEKIFRRRLGLTPAPDFTINNPPFDVISSGTTIIPSLNYKNITFPIEVNFQEGFLLLNQDQSLQVIYLYEARLYKAR